MSVDIRREQGSTQDGSRDVGGGQRKEEEDWTEGAGVSGETGSHGTSSCCVHRQQCSKRTERLGEREISSDRTGTSDRFCSQPSGAYDPKQWESRICTGKEQSPVKGMI